MCPHILSLHVTYMHARAAPDCVDNCDDGSNHYAWSDGSQCVCSGACSRLIPAPGYQLAVFNGTVSGWGAGLLMFADDDLWLW